MSRWILWLSDPKRGCSTAKRPKKKTNRKKPLQISSGTFWALLKRRQRRIWAFLSRVEMRGTKRCGGGGALWTSETSNQFRKQQEADALPPVAARWDLASPFLSSPVRIPVFPAQMRDIPDTCVKLQASFERWIPPRPRLRTGRRSDDVSAWHVCQLL